SISADASPLLLSLYSLFFLPYFHDHLTKKTLAEIKLPPPLKLRHDYTASDPLPRSASVVVSRCSRRRVSSLSVGATPLPRQARVRRCLHRGRLPSSKPPPSTATPLIVEAAAVAIAPPMDPGVRLSVCRFCRAVIISFVTVDAYL
ncbi:hypothetical protein LINPERPRIM_LOCUS40954, partial [Linum perenne]